MRAVQYVEAVCGALMALIRPQLIVKVGELPVDDEGTQGTSALHRINTDVSGQPEYRVNHVQ
ncbi:hypothetical protein [Nonomuraea fuscirosea]|uniref:hypothetical protein n=1 Tax=Nonomuraea fuscirosea TaxID=1291556 RepID=UPI003438E675